MEGKSSPCGTRWHLSVQSGYNNKERYMLDWSKTAQKRGNGTHPLPHQVSN
jgi:hypothetical protein